MNENEYGVVTDAPVLLTYTIMTDPAPLSASTPTYNSYGTITVTVSPAAASVYCKEIDIYIPSGIVSRTDQFVASADSSNWQTHVGKEVPGNQVGLNPRLSYVQVKFMCKSPEFYLVASPVNLTVGIQQMTQQPGWIGSLGLTEMSTNDSSQPYILRSMTFGVSVGAALLFARNFTASAADGGASPAGVFTNGQPIQLSWESNGTEFQIFEAAGSGPLYTGTDNSFKLSSGLAKTTTFILAASQTDLRAETQYIYDSVTVVISNEDSTPHSVTAAGTVSGALVESTGEMLAQGKFTASGGASLEGQIDVNGPLNVEGGIQCNGEMSINGTLSATNTAAFQSVIVSGLLGLRGGSNIFGVPMPLLSDNGVTYIAHTDGYAIATINPPGGDISSTISTCTVTLLTFLNGQTLYELSATGGLATAYNSSWTTVNWYSPNSVTMPVPQGYRWQILVNQYSGNDKNPTVSLFWIPLGNNEG
ncbi:hypothetical protein [Paenibacillus sp. FJAT-26967]|uniref:hypothetical protein n=1 Tax=Paenibacillus sp. FJAT-26967 TaxID=1729690 RepID=UPI000837B52F|nr:hypothetical protein [Paenibacillus sp. FJAT-26967]